MKLVINKIRVRGQDRCKRSFPGQRCALRKFQVIEGPNALHQIAFNAFHSFLKEVQTTGCICMWHAFVIETCRLVLQTPLVARKTTKTTTKGSILQHSVYFRRKQPFRTASFSTSVHFPAGQCRSLLSFSCLCRHFEFLVVQI